MNRPVGKRLFVGCVVLAVVVFASIVYSHCQVPCGIYGDKARFEMIAENVATIEKSMKQINHLSGDPQRNMNQIVRWVQNKEKHADDNAHIITYYFMAQRIKPVDKTEAKAYEKYVRKLTLLHEMLVYNMKAKQTTDLANVEKIRALLAEFQAAYPQ